MPGGSGVAASLHTALNRVLIDAFTNRLMPLPRLSPMRLSLLPTAVVLLACLLAMPAGAEGPSRRDGDSDYARDGVRRGTLVRLERLLADAERRYPGRVIEVELDDDHDEYEIEILMRDGRVVELTYDARSGRLLEIEIDD